MNITNSVFCMILASLLSLSAAAQTKVPHEFQAGTPARASDVNENFDALEQAIDLNATDIQQVQGLAGLSAQAAQIQTGLDLTSGLRWLITNLYVENGFIADDNAGAGAPPATNWNNRFVAGANIVSGVIHIQFRADAAPQLANQFVYLTPVDPGSGSLWFDCSGDGVTDPFVAELNCAFSDGPYMPIYVPRRQVDTAFDLLDQSNAQQLIQDFFNTNGFFPSDNQQAGLDFPTGYQNNYVTELVVSSEGVISLTFGGPAHPSITGRTLNWTPDDRGGSIRWDCSSIDIHNNFLPPICR